MGVAFTIRWRQLRLEQQYRRAIQEVQNFKPEMDIAGKWLVNDGRSRLQARNSLVSIGRLGKSLMHRAFQRALTIFSSRPYATIQQEGGEIRARNRRFLAIPMKIELARRHVWPKHLKPKTLFYVRGKDGRRWLINRKLGEVWYMLIDRVRIKGRPYIVYSTQFRALVKRLIVAKFERIRKAG